MKQLKNILFLASLLTVSSGAWAQKDNTDLGHDPKMENAWEGDSLISPLTEPLLTSKLRLLTRTYGDRVCLRWLPEDYVSWRTLCQSGVNVLRQHRESGQIDTLALELKPLTQKQFEAKYPQSDSLAMIAMGTLYGEGRLGENQTREKPGTQGANVELNNEQDLSFAYAMLVAEWRPDLAEALAVGLTDRTAHRSQHYDYYIQPSTTDFGGRIIFEPGVEVNVENLLYKPQPYDPHLQYEQVSPRRIAVNWIDPHHSSYEVERREKGQTAWQRLNERPYISMVQETDIEGLSIYNDSVPHDGTWEYRVMGHDAFGTLSEPSPVLTAHARDIEPPRAPQLKYIVIERPDDDKPSGRVLAHVVWQLSDSLENDLQGYLVHYYNERLTGHQWRPMGDELVSPRDTMTTIDVTGLRTGMLCVMAYDNSGNTGQSLAQLIRITDYKAPAAPDSLRAIVLPTGHVILSWQPRPEDNDIDYYDVAFANDSTHNFLLANEGGIHDPMYVDSLALDVNQKYIYYKVRAVDTENNFGDWTPILQVLRPHDSPPTAPHLDESWHNDQQGMHMRWIVGTDADMTYHELRRRLGQDGQWEVIARWDADSLAAAGSYAVVVNDNPPYDQEKRYYYMVKSYNSTPYTSSSLAVSWLHQGPHFLDIPISLTGAWVAHEGLVRLTWDAKVDASLAGLDYYYCVFRKSPGDKRFRYVLNVDKNTFDYSDRKLQEGQEAQYYISIRFKDGRESRESNVVKVKR